MIGDYLKRWVINWRNISRDSFSFLGSIVLIIELRNFFVPDFLKSINTENTFGQILLGCLFFGIVKNHPRLSISQKIRDKDVSIEIKIGDAFNNKGGLIVPINNEFDLSLNGNVKKAKSLQNKLITKYYDSKEEHLMADISQKIDLSKLPYCIGTVIEIEQKNKTFYLLVNSNKKENCRVNSNLDDFMISITKIWDYLAKNAGIDEPVTIPLINAQHGRDPNLTRDTAIKQIIKTFIDETKHRVVCEKLIISINPSDIEKGQINFDSLSECLKSECLNYTDIKFDKKPEGLPASTSPSATKSIRS